MKPTTLKPSKWLMQQSAAARVWVLLSVGLGFTSGLLLILQASLLSHIIHSAFISHLPRALLWRSLLGLALLYILRAGVSWLREIVGFHTASQVKTAVRKQLWQKIYALGPVYLQQYGSSAAISSHLIEQVEALTNFFSKYLPQMSLAVMLPIAILCFVFPLSWVAGLVLLITAPLIPVFMALIGMGAASINRRNFQALARMSTHFLDVLQGLTTLKLFHRSKDQAEQIARVSADFRMTTMSVLRVAFLSSAVLELFASISIALVATYLGLSFLGFLHFGHYADVLTLQTGLFILLLAPDFYLPLRDLGSYYHARAEAVAAAEEMLQLLTAPVPVSADKGVCKIQALDLAFQKVSFSYAERSQPVLKQIQIVIPHGKKVAIVGPSGAGKTTLMNLLLGFIQPTAGSIKVGQNKLSSIDEVTWKQQISWLGQRPQLFYGTIRSNLLVAKPDASETELQEAVAIAQAQFIEQLPLGLDTPIAEGNSGLSGGQIQRIALARACLKPSGILLLDEPCTNLDPQTADLIMSALLSRQKTQTLVLLTHRLADLKQVDEILVLSEGEVVQQGSFAALKRRKGLFAELLQHQEFYDA